jgi:hypothetical protein
LEEHVTSIFTVKEKAKQETSMKQVASYACYPEDGSYKSIQNVC